MDIKLDEYRHIKDKAHFFEKGGDKIDRDVDGLFDRIKEFKEKGSSFIFRGCREAKFMLYNSAQREYINSRLFEQSAESSVEDHYKKYVMALIIGCKDWNAGVIKKLFVHSGIEEDNSLAYLSYMQHYGIPTPLLDYSYNPYVALFIAVDGLTYVPSQIDIDNYFSLYYTYTTSTVFEVCKSVFDNTVKTNQKISYDDMDGNVMSIITPDDKFYQVINSLNIINQEGLFFYNHHPFYPLERLYKELTSLLVDEKGREFFDQLLMHDTLSGCFNIHKSLVPEILERLDEIGIYRHFVYPTTENLKKSLKLVSV